MLGKEVWEDMTKEEIMELKEEDKDRKPIGCKWVFKIKRNGSYRARLVAQGFTQIRGIDYDENYSPVVKDICHRIVMAKAMAEKEWKKTITDVETAFLYGVLDVTLFMACPPGYKLIMKEIMEEKGILINEDDLDKIEYVLLRKSIYGLLQAART